MVWGFGGSLSTAAEPKTSSTIISKVEGKRESKNRPVATNFQFLKILCPSGTALLQRSRVFEVLLLGRACPKPCWERVGQDATFPSDARLFAGEISI